MLPAQPNQSLIEGLACLQAVISRQAPVGSRELARELNLEATRVNRLLKTLAHLGLVQQNQQRKYGPGPRLHVLSAQALYGSGLLRRALRPLAELQQHGLIVALGVLWRDQVCYLYHAQPGMPAAEAIGRVALYPASRSGIGMPLLAALPTSEVRALYQGQAEIPGHASWKELQAELTRVRAAGHAYVTINRDTGVHSLGIPVGDPPYAALAFSGDIKRSDIARLLPALQAAAATIGVAPA